LQTKEETSKPYKKKKKSMVNQRKKRIGGTKREQTRERIIKNTQSDLAGKPHKLCPSN